MLSGLLLSVAGGMVGIVYTLFRKFVRRPLGIHDLPLELLSEITSHLDFIDVISLRQSTRKLREATEARVVWHSLAKKYSARYLNIPCPENGTIDTLTTGDLRQWIWPRLTIDQIWRKKTLVPTKRIFSVHEDSGHLRLLPGGRWLLAVRETGHVYFYDLGSKEPTPKLLLEPSLPGNEEAGPNRIVVAINRNAPALDFILAISTSGSILDENPKFGWLHIRQVQLAGSGESATLSARKLVSIPPIRRDAATCAIALSGDLVARDVSKGGNEWIEVFRWKECTSKELKVAIIRSPANMRNGYIFFIGEDRILCVVYHTIFILRIPPLGHLPIYWNHEVEYRSGEYPAEVLWCYDKEFHLRNIPCLYFDGSTGYRLVVQERNMLMGIFIPLSLDSLPCTQFRSQPVFFKTIYTGLYKGVVMNLKAPYFRIGYGWGNEAGVNFVYQQSKEYFHDANVLLDEETGRCVLKRSRTEVWVFDFTSC